VTKKSSSTAQNIHHLLTTPRLIEGNGGETHGGRILGSSSKQGKKDLLQRENIKQVEIGSGMDISCGERLSSSK